MPHRIEAVFLDRDGVLNVPAPFQKRYVTRWEEFKFLPGVLSALRQLKRNRMKVMVISNQSGVGRGWMTASALEEITRRMLKAIRRAGGHIHAVYYCTHAPSDRCSCRKPKPGLIRRACKEWGIRPDRAVVVGDQWKDIQMGKAVGCKTVLVRSALTFKDKVASHPDRIRPDRTVRNLNEAVHWILKERIATR